MSPRMSSEAVASQKRPSSTASARRIAIVLFISLPIGPFSRSLFEMALERRETLPGFHEEKKGCQAIQDRAKPPGTGPELEPIGHPRDARLDLLLANAGGEALEDHRPMRHLYRGHPWTIEGDVHGIHGEAGEAASSCASGLDSKAGAAGAVEKGGPLP